MEKGSRIVTVSLYHVRGLTLLVVTVVTQARGQVCHGGLVCILRLESIKSSLWQSRFFNLGRMSHTSRFLKSITWTWTLHQVRYSTFFSKLRFFPKMTLFLSRAQILEVWRPESAEFHPARVSPKDLVSVRLPWYFRSQFLFLWRLPCLWYFRFSFFSFPLFKFWMFLRFSKSLGQNPDFVIPLDLPVYNL